jgi:hypothetical protein
MAILNLRNTERSEAGTLVGQGGEFRPSQNHSSAGTSRPLPTFPEHIQLRILHTVENAGGWVSRADIARLLGLKKTPWLVMNLEALVTAGYLHRDQVIRPCGMMMYYYEVAR